MLLMVVMMTLCGCEQADSIYNKLSDSFEMTDDELVALSERRLRLNAEGDSSFSGLSDIEGPNVDGVTDGIASLGNQAKSASYKALSSACSWLKNYGFIICGASIFLGIVIMRLARKSINIRRKALFYLVIGIPVVTLVAMYGTAFLADSMLR